jgi:hypothetical protein
MEESEPDEPPSRKENRRQRLNVDDSEAGPPGTFPNPPTFKPSTHAEETSTSDSLWHKATTKGFLWLQHVKSLVFCSRINVLLAFVPAGIAVGFAKVDPIVVFILNALAIIPLAVVISTSTEKIAHRLGDTLGALFNVTVGNTAELSTHRLALRAVAVC